MNWYEPEGAEKVRADTAPRLDLTLLRSNRGYGSGSMGMDYSGDPAITLGDNIDWDRGYLLDGQPVALDGTTVLEDDYVSMTGSLPGSGASVRVKRPGLWQVSAMLTLVSPVTKPVAVNIITDVTPTSTIVGFLPAAAAAFGYTAVVALTSEFQMTLDAYADDLGIVVTYAAIVATPLFLEAL